MLVNTTKYAALGADDVKRRELHIDYFFIDRL